MSNQIGTVLGVRFEIDHYPVDGFQLTLRNDETNELLFDKRMVCYTEFEALMFAVDEVWATELEEHGETSYDLTLRIAEVLNVEELFDEDEEEDNWEK